MNRDLNKRKTAVTYIGSRDATVLKMGLPSYIEVDLLRKYF